MTAAVCLYAGGRVVVRGDSRGCGWLVWLVGDGDLLLSREDDNVRVCVSLCVLCGFGDPRERGFLYSFCVLKMNLSSNLQSDDITKT